VNALLAHDGRGVGHVARPHEPHERGGDERVEEGHEHEAGEDFVGEDAHVEADVEHDQLHQPLGVEQNADRQRFPDFFCLFVSHIHQSNVCGVCGVACAVSWVVPPRVIQDARRDRGTADFAHDRREDDQHRHHTACPRTHTSVSHASIFFFDI
jgi:hypothetical protein